MPGLSYSSLRVRELYTIVNHGERYDVEVVSILSSKDFLLKDIHTLETIKMSEITQFGKGKDWLITEL